MNVTDLLAQGWEYRGEGNANIAISLPKIRKILRIPKTEKPKTVLGWLMAWLREILKWNYNKEVEHERRNLNFYNYVMVPFFGETFAQPAIEIKTYPSIIRKMEKLLLPHRPEHRKHKRLQVWTASLLADYAFLPKQLTVHGLVGSTFSIEIKPKQGWIPVSERNFDQCLFCLNQFLKLKRGQVKEMSLYCPLDLFSGQKTRMLQALKSLIQIPQNNFRVFKNGSYYYGESSSLDRFNSFLCEFFDHTFYTDKFGDNFCSLLIQALLRNFDSTSETFMENHFDETVGMKPNEKKVCIFEEPQLPRGCILEKILSVQKLNRLGLNKYQELYSELMKIEKIDKWDYVDKFLQQELEELHLQNIGIQSNLSLVPYLLAAVAYDCSFMITMQKLQNDSEPISNHHLITDGVHNFMVNIGIFDVYPKPAQTIIKHVKRHEDILDVCLCNSQRLFCRDS